MFLVVVLRCLPRPLAHGVSFAQRGPFLRSMMASPISEKIKNQKSKKSQRTVERLYRKGSALNEKLNTPPGREMVGQGEPRP